MIDLARAGHGEPAFFSAAAGDGDVGGDGGGDGGGGANGDVCGVGGLAPAERYPIAAHSAIVSPARGRRVIAMYTQAADATAGGSGSSGGGVLRVFDVDSRTRLRQQPMAAALQVRRRVRARARGGRDGTTNRALRVRGDGTKKRGAWMVWGAHVAAYESRALLLSRMSFMWLFSLDLACSHSFSLVLTRYHSFSLVLTWHVAGATVTAAALDCCDVDDDDV